VFTEWFRAHEHEIAVPVFVLYERRKGIEAVPEGRRRRELDRAYRRLLLRFGEAILPFGQLEAWHAAEYFQVLTACRGAGFVEQIGLVDLFIGATARAHGLAGVTRNARHFPHCDVFLPWLSAAP
jgi:predicted nucleic acid-binding protein